MKALARIANEYIHDYLQRRPEMKQLYGKRSFARPSAKGPRYMQLEYGYGVNDFDVWSFFGIAPSGPPKGMFLRSATVRYFGRSKFHDGPISGKDPARRVDLFWRSIQVKENDAIRSVQNWLVSGSASASHLNRKAVVLIDPPDLCGEVIWLFGQPFKRCLT